jgi:hypothetical protein
MLFILPPFALIPAVAGLWSPAAGHFFLAEGRWLTADGGFLPETWHPILGTCISAWQFSKPML